MMERTTEKGEMQLIMTDRPHLAFEFTDSGVPFSVSTCLP